MADADYTNEIWKAISGYEGLYEISSRGRVRSLERSVRNSAKSFRTVPAQVIAPCLHTGNYLCVKLAKERAKRWHYIHRLVAAAFIGPVPAGEEVRHRDGVKAHNWQENLEYGTRAQNIEDNRRQGKMPLGTKHGCAKLTEHQVLDIMKDVRPSYIIARDYPVSAGMISNIKRGVNWRHLSPQ